VGISLGPFLMRQMAAMIRGEKAFSDRQGTVLGVGLIVLGVLVYWDWKGLDRTSILGARELGRAIFGWIVFVKLMGMREVATQVASSIASERDRKTLDVLLSSRLSSAEIVLGTASAALFGYANEVLPVVPVVALLVFLGVVDPTLVIVVASGMASVAVLVAGFSAVASVGVRTSTIANSTTAGLIMAWLLVPMIYILLRSLAWPGAPGWLTSAVLVLFDASPTGLALNLKGTIPRPGGPIEAVGRMVGYQALASLALFGWSIARLRPASRSMHDMKEEWGRIARIKAALRRADRRPPCGDDPVLWQEMHAGRVEGLVGRLAGLAIIVAMLAGLGAGTLWLAVPAFRELAARGYGPSPEALSVNPLQVFAGLRNTFPAPGQARLVFNIALRLVSGIFTLVLVGWIGMFAQESIGQERARDTWLGLITTPLTGREILRGKALGTVWKFRWGALTMVALWAIGLASGALHPLGFLASLAFLAAMMALGVNGGLSTALNTCQLENLGKPPDEPVPPLKMLLSTLLMLALLVPLLLLLLVVVVLGVALLIALGFLGCLASLGYEDVAAAFRGGPFPLFGDWPISKWISARGMLLAWLIGTVAIAIRAGYVWRSNRRRFDQAVGRPVRLPPSREADRIEALRRGSTLG
jgi:ABC-type Na+ efflux pump permease subunit